MVPSAHENSIMIKSTATTSSTLTSCLPSLYHSKSLYATHALTAKDSIISVQNLKKSTVNFAKLTTDDQTMHSTDDHPDDDDVDSSTEFLTNLIHTTPKCLIA